MGVELASTIDLAIAIITSRSFLPIVRVGGGEEGWGLKNSIHCRCPFFDERERKKYFIHMISNYLPFLLMSKLVIRDQVV